MKVSIPEQQSLVLSQAILLYSPEFSKGGGDVAYASLHEIDGKNKIRAGTPLGRDALMAMLYALANKHGVATVQWNSQSTIASSPRLQVWWTPAQRRWVFLQNGEKTEQAGYVALPPMAWIARDKGLWVYALKENAMPGPDTQLWHAPLFNVYDDGAVCQGSMAVGQERTADDWEKGFFGARFTHANPPNRKVSKHRQGNQGMWASLFRDGKKETAEFSLDLLLPLKSTLGQVVQKLEN